MRSVCARCYARPIVKPDAPHPPSEERRHGFSFAPLDALTAMQNCKTLDGFAFSVLLNEDGAGRLELTKP